MSASEAGLFWQYVLYIEKSSFYKHKDSNNKYIKDMA